ncbi:MULTISPECIES: hypothetical protein [Mameliella]|uniref:hypothetical protein n=1 Tax=Mameliella TaxID=1434019 RepID=UPI0010559AAC|nr:MULTISPECIES: hypothetical protein [Mameliella]MCR9272798.1 hypothetical protein [Paracoccaceae bacterium]
MQGSELENSRTVLQHQAQELASSARAHRDQAQAASDSIAQQNRVYTASLWLKTRNLEVVIAEKLEILSKFLDNQEPRSPLLSSDFRELLESMRVSILKPYGIKNSTTKTPKDEYKDIKRAFQESFPIPDLEKYSNDERKSALAYSLDRRATALLEKVLTEQEKSETRKRKDEAKNPETTPEARSRLS